MHLRNMVASVISIFMEMTNCGPPVKLIFNSVEMSTAYALGFPTLTCFCYVPLMRDLHPPRTLPPTPRSRPSGPPRFPVTFVTFVNFVPFRESLALPRWRI